LHGILLRIEEGTLRLHARDTTEPSPFAHEVLNAKPYAFLDDAPLEERRTRALSLRRTLPEHQRDLGALDVEAIAKVAAEARPEPRNADELHDALLGLVLCRTPPAWDAWLDELVVAGRAARVSTAVGAFAFAAEHARTIAVLYPDAAVVPKLEPRARLDGLGYDRRDDAVLAVLRGHSETSGPFTTGAVASAFALEAWEVASAAARLESEGAVLRGRFTVGVSTSAEEELCDRRLLARIHRYTLDRLRREIEPVTAQDFMRYLLQRHHLDPRARAGGRAGLRDAIAMLQGFEIAAASWETEILAPRVAGYKSEWLDELCLAGEVTYCRLSPRRGASPRGTSDDTPEAVTRGSTSRATPLAIARRRDLGWLLGAVRGSTDPEPPTSPASVAVLTALGKRGALFFDDLVPATGLDGPALIAALWDVVGSGLVAPDGFQPLRDLMAKGRRRPRGPVHGRWSLVERLEPEPLDGDALADRVAEQLLSRYGVVFRSLSERESFAVPWRDVLRALRRREARGLVRGGRFVTGVMGEQYALPEAVDALRRARRDDRSLLTLRVSATDPLNLVGILTPGPRVPAHTGAFVVFRDGAALSLGDETPPVAHAGTDAAPV